MSESAGPLLSRPSPPRSLLVKRNIRRHLPDPSSHSHRQLTEPSPTSLSRQRPPLPPPIVPTATAARSASQLLQRLPLLLSLSLSPSRACPCRTPSANCPLLRRFPHPRIQPRPRSARSPPRADLPLHRGVPPPNSGFNANAGFFTCAPQLDDVLLHDGAIHVSAHDGACASRVAPRIRRPFAHNEVRAFHATPRALRDGWKARAVCSLLSGAWVAWMGPPLRFARCLMP
jgi:hypothetical protein